MIGTINKDSKWGELYLSEEFKKNSVFKHADLKSMDDLSILYYWVLISTDAILTHQSPPMVTRV